MQARFFLAVLLGVLASYLPYASSITAKVETNWKVQHLSVASTFITPHGAQSLECIRGGDVDYFAASYFAYDWATQEICATKLFTGIGTGRFISGGNSPWYEETVTYWFPNNYTSLNIAGASHWVPYNLVRSVIGGTGKYMGASGQAYFSIVVHPTAGVIVAGNITIITPYVVSNWPKGFNQTLPAGP